MLRINTLPMMKHLSTILFLATALLASLPAAADDYIVVAQQQRVFDEPKTDGYATTNRDGADVVIAPGMAFKVIDKGIGWAVIEYSPGLKGYVMLSMMEDNSHLAAPAAGTYTVGNAKGDKLTVKGTGKYWAATSTRHPAQMRGEINGSVLVFFDEHDHPAYTVTLVGGQPRALAYDNALTRFF